MTQLLLEPDRTDPPQPRERQRTRRGLLAAVATVAGAALLVPLAPRAWDVLPSWGNPFASKVVDHSPAPLVLALKDLADYHAASGTFQAVVDIERDTANLPAVVSGERVTFLAVGTVDAVVDFSGIGPERVAVSEDGRSVTVSLPSPRLAEAAIDHDASRVLDRDRGLLERIGGAFAENPTSDQEIYRLAEAKLEASAQHSDLVHRAEQNTRAMLTKLAGSLGFEQVTVTFDAAQV